jgi:plastocyanin
MMAAVRITEPLIRVLSRVPTQGTLACLLAGGLTLAVPVTPTAFSPNSPAGVGRIEGTVRLVAPGTNTIPSGAYPSRRVTKPHQNPSEIENVVVFVKDMPRAGALPAARAQIRQEGEAFVPQLVAITRGSTVEFPNADPYFHNVFSLSRGATFDLGRFPRGESRSRTFTRPGLVKVYCHLHSHMSAAIMVFDHPHFSVPETSGAFAIEDVPAGSYRLAAWHERIGENTKAITIQAGVTSRIEFSLPVATEW